MRRGGEEKIGRGGKKNAEEVSMDDSVLGGADGQKNISCTSSEGHSSSSCSWLVAAATIILSEPSSEAISTGEGEREGAAERRKIPEKNGK